MRRAREAEVKFNIAPLACALTLLSPLTAMAQSASVAEFYKGKTINLIVGAAAGGAYDLVARTMAIHYGRHVPGNPRFVVSNLPGASSLPLVNQMANTMKKDGTIMGMSNSNIALERSLKMLSKGGGHVGFDVRKLQWIGSPLQQPHVLWVWHAAPAKTADDIRTNKIIVGSTGVGGDNYMLPVMLNRLIGAKFEIISGYVGQNDIFVAAERGEIHGNSAILPNLTSAKPEWFRDAKVRVLVQFGTHRMPAIKDVPTAIELASDAADKEMLRFYALKFAMAYPLLMAQDVPPERIAAMREGFDETMKDAAFLEDARKLGLDVDPFSGAQMEKLIQDMENTPREIVDRVAAIIAAAERK